MKNNIKSVVLNNSFYKSDILDITKYPNEAINSKFHQNSKSNIINLEGIKSNKIKEEIKLYLDYLLNSEFEKESSLRESYLKPLGKFVGFLKEEENVNVFSIVNSNNEIRDLYKEYLLKKGFYVLHKSKKWVGEGVNVIIFDKLKTYIEEVYDERDGFDRDIWYIDKLSIASHRINKTQSIKSISFKDISNLKNRELVKKYIKYLIGNTDKSLSTIRGEYKNIKDFINFIGEKEIINLNRQDIEKYYIYLNDRSIEDKTFNRFIYSNLVFIQYLELKNIISENNFYYQDTKVINIKRKYSSIDTFVTHQIFNVLGEIDKNISLIFLIIYCTGMRVSNACQLKTDSIYKNSDGFFIKSYNQKMKKYEPNPIPENLYHLIISRIKENRKIYDYGEEYLFPSDMHKPYLAEHYRIKMQEALKSKGIKNPDGSEYIYKCHDYRHTLATEMLNKDIPLNVIQTILHHESQEMTLAYAEINDDRRIKKHKEFINIKGEFAPIKSDIKIDEISKVEWLRENINAQILPNGVCALPVKMKKCPHANSCLTCPQFRTNEKYLEIHKQQLKNVDKYLEIAIKNNWVRQIETNKEIRRNLIKIIESIESCCDKRV